MTSSKIAESLASYGISPDCSLEELINEIESLGYDKLILSRTLKGYKCTLTYKGNAYVKNTLLAKNRRDAVAVSLLWGLEEIQDYSNA